MITTTVKAPLRLVRVKSTYRKHALSYDRRLSGTLFHDVDVLGAKILCRGIASDSIHSRTKPFHKRIRKTNYESKNVLKSNSVRTFLTSPIAQFRFKLENAFWNQLEQVNRLAVRIGMFQASPGVAAAPLRAGSRLDFDCRLLSVLSYNILAPIYVRTVDERTGSIQPFAAFEWAEPADEVLHWSVRQEKLKKQISNANADVLCLQEVQLSFKLGNFVPPIWLQSIAEKQNYEICLPSQAALESMASRNLRVLRKYAPVASLVLYRKDRLEPACVAEDAVNPVSSNIVCVFLQGKPESGLSNLGPTVFVSAHLDAMSEVRRVIQMQRIIEAVNLFGSRHCVVAGDFNSELRRASCLGGLITDQNIFHSVDGAELYSQCAIDNRQNAVTMQELQEYSDTRVEAKAHQLRHRVGLVRASNGPTRSAYSYDGSRRMDNWTLDHILFNDRSLKLLNVYETLEVDPFSKARGLPNKYWPSDHRPVAACFLPSKPHELTALERASCVELWKNFNEKLATEMSALAEGLDEDEAKLRKEVQKIWANDPDLVARAKKKRKALTGRLPEFMITFLRGKSAKIKDLKKRQSSERLKYIENLSLAAVDILEDEGLLAREEIIKALRQSWSMDESMTHSV